jgi:hypothetical protein
VLSALTDVLGMDTGLRDICVGDTTFGDDGLAALGHALGETCLLESLDLENKGLTDKVCCNL